MTSTMFVIDVRPVAEYGAGHFPGAVSFCLTELESRAEEIPTDAAIVVYCRGEPCLLAREAAAVLREQSFDAKAIDEGVMEWRTSKGVDLEVV